MKKFLTAIIALMAIVPLIATAAPKREVRGVWFTTVWAIDWPSVQGTTASVQASQKAELIKYLDKLKSQNFNTVCFQVRSNCDAFYASSYEPWSSSISGTRGTSPGWDPLAFAVQECHKRGMECWAWVNPFRQRTSATNYTTTFDKNAANNGWILSYGGYYVLNPGITAVRQHILKVCKEIYTNYAIDGMLFDDYFYPNNIPESSSAGDYTLYKNSGTSLSIGNWRRNNINTFMSELRAAINADRPDLRFGVGPAGVAYLGGSAYGISKPSGVSSTDWQYGTIYSDPIAWLANGSIDFISPQIYWKTTNSAAPYGPLASWWSDVANRFNRHFYGSHASYNVSSDAWGNNSTTWADFVKQIDFNRNYTKNNAAGSLFYNHTCLNGPSYSGLGDYVATNRFQTKSLTPKVTWRNRTNYAGPATVNKSGSTLSWSAVAGAKSNSIIRYSVYAVPKSVTKAAAAASDGDGLNHQYLLDVVYGTSYTIPSGKTDGYWYAVCTLDGFSYESTPTCYGLDPTLYATVSSYTYTCDYGSTAMHTFEVVGQNLTDDIVVTSNSPNFVVTLTTLSRTGGWIDVKFVPTAVGTVTGTLTIKSSGKTATIALTGTARSVEPALSVPTTSYTFTCEYGKSAMNTFQVIGQNLTEDIVVTSNSANFQVTKTTLTRTGGWIDVKFTPTYKGNFSGTLTMKANNKTATIALTGVATAPVPRFTEVWNISDTKGNLTSKGWDATQVRNIEYSLGKLYLVYQQNDIKVINARTGEDLGFLNKARVKGGTVRLADVKMCDGKLVASNIALTRNNDHLRLYVWDNDGAAARLILDTDDFGGAVRIGDYIGFKGTWASGEFLFCSDDGICTRIIRYAVTDGAVSKTPTVIKVTSDGSTPIFTDISARVIPEDDGYWINGRANTATFVGLDGVRKFYVNQWPAWGNAFKAFTYKGSTFGLMSFYDPTASSEGMKGRMRLFNADNGWQNTTYVADYPADGLSATRTNGNATSGICTSINGDAMEVWLSITNQGLAYYQLEGTTPPSYTVSALPTVKPYIMLSRWSASITAKEGMNASQSVTISGAFTYDDITLSLEGADAAMFSLSTDRIGMDSEAETVYVNFLGDKAGVYKATLRASSEDCDDVTVSVTATVTADGYFNPSVTNLEEKWIYSDNRDNLDAAPWFVSSQLVSRDMCVANHKLYMLNTAPWSNSPEIKIVGPYSGALTGRLRMEGISGGETPAASIRELGGHVIVSNGARAAVDPLRVYKWYNDDCAPVLWMEDYYHGAAHVGENMSVYGDMSSGKLIFSDGRVVLFYDVVKGHANNTPRVVNLTREGSPYNVGADKGSVSVTLLDDGSFWVTGKDVYATHFDADGEYIEAFTAENVTGSNLGVSSSFFTVGDRLIMATATYIEGIDLKSGQQTLADNRKSAAIAIVDYTEGVELARTTALYPEEGLSAAGTTSYPTVVTTEKSSDGERVNLWLLAPTQGLVYYKFDAAQLPSGVGPVMLDETESKPVYFNLQGIRVDGENLSPGIYLKRSGNHTEKVLIR